MLHNYPVLCYTPGCGKRAEYKVAARWSDGIVSELKTYALCCAGCLPAWFPRARGKQAGCRLTAGESLEPPGIYQMQHGRRDQQLRRQPELEEQLLSR